MVFGVSDAVFGQNFLRRVHILVDKFVHRHDEYHTFSLPRIAPVSNTHMPVNANTGIVAIFQICEGGTRE
jgi:hypothetical protein